MPRKPRERPPRKPKGGKLMHQKDEPLSEKLDEIVAQARHIREGDTLGRVLEAVERKGGK